MPALISGVRTLVRVPVASMLNVKWSTITLSVAVLLALLEILLPDASNNKHPLLLFQAVIPVCLRLVGPTLSVAILAACLHVLVCLTTWGVPLTVVLSAQLVPNAPATWPVRKNAVEILARAHVGHWLYVGW